MAFGHSNKLSVLKPLLNVYIHKISLQWIGVAAGDNLSQEGDLFHLNFIYLFFEFHSMVEKMKCDCMVIYIVRMHT